MYIPIIISSDEENSVVNENIWHIICPSSEAYTYLQTVILSCRYFFWKTKMSGICNIYNHTTGPSAHPIDFGLYYKLWNHFGGKSGSIHQNSIPSSSNGCIIFCRNIFMCLSLSSDFILSHWLLFLILSGFSCFLTHK